MAVTVVATEADTGLSGASRTVTFTGYSAQEDDVIVLAAPTTTSAAVATPVSGWELVGERAASGGVMDLCVVYHVVTSGEVGQNSFTATSLFNTSETGDVAAVALRGVDLAAVIDDQVSHTETGVTPHSFPALTGANLSDGSLVIGVIAADEGTPVTYGTPAGWTSGVDYGGSMGGGIYTRDTATSAGVNVDATSITPSASSTYVAFTIAFTAAEEVAPGGPATLEVWNGTSWTEYPFEVWTGSNWV